MSTSPSSALVTEAAALDYAQSVLQPHLGWTPASATHLSGGLVNYVYRLTSAAGAQPCRTAILKSYPPFIARAPHVAFSQERFAVECAALSLIGAQQASWAARTRARVPDIIFADPAHFCLVMQDAGAAAWSLTDVLRESRSPVSAPPRCTWAALAKDLFEFLSLVFSLKLSTEARGVFANPSAWECLGRHFGSFAQLGGEFPELVPIIERCHPFEAPGPELESRVGLILGDLWPNSVLVGEDGVVWVIDWELARHDEFPCDYSQLMANLFVMASQERCGKGVRTFRTGDIEALMQSLRTAFSTRCGRELCSRSSRNPAEHFVRAVALLMKYEHFEIHDRKELVGLAIQVMGD